MTRFAALAMKSKRAERKSHRPLASIVNASPPISFVHGFSSQEAVLPCTMLRIQPKCGMNATLIGPEHGCNILDFVAARSQSASGFLLNLVQAHATLRNMVEFDPGFGVNESSHWVPPLAIGGARSSSPVAVGGAAVWRSAAASLTGLSRLHGSAPSRHFHTATFCESNLFHPQSAVAGNNLLGVLSSSLRVLALALSRGVTPPRRRTRVSNFPRSLAATGGECGDPAMCPPVSTGSPHQLPIGSSLFPVGLGPRVACRVAELRRRSRVAPLPPAPFPHSTLSTKRSL